MPYKPYWLQRLPEIVDRLKTLSVATIDRRTFESIFRLRRRRAIELMHVLGSYRGRRGFVLDRCALLQKLDSLDTVTRYRWEQQVRLPWVIGLLGQGEVNAVKEPNEIHLGPGRLLLEFADEGELIEKLLIVLRAASDGRQAPVISRGAWAPRELQFGRFEQAIQALRKQQFYEAGTLFAQACAGPDERIRASAETYLRMCKRRTEKVPEPSSFEDHYTYGVALLNDRRLPEARKQFESALQLNPCADYVYYALAACLALCGDMSGFYSNLRCAIELQPRNRIAARSDPDLREALQDPAVRQLLNCDCCEI